MKISIAMATYNGEAYLQDQLDSFVKQTRQPDELVVTDDCSTDATPELLEAFGRVAPFPVRVLRNNQNLGHVKAFEKSLLECLGDYIFLSDQDDIWYENKIARVLDELEASCRYLVCLNDADLVDSDLNHIGATRLERRRRLKLPDTKYNTGCCAALRREYVNSFIPFPKDCDAHDAWLLRIATRTKSSALIQETLQLMRRHEKNTSAGADKDVSLPFLLLFFRRASVKIIPPRVSLASDVSFVKFCINEYIPTLIDRYRDQIPAIEDALKAFGEVERSELNKLERRRQVLTLSPWKRFFPVYGAYRAGVYDQWDGIITALRDLIRPRSHG